jgi:GrpB-like predicted nucleotidyltransferase (UPF0157 family)
VHIHVRQSGSWSEQFSLLFRDYLRARSEAASAYSKLKHQLAAEHHANREVYTETKGPIVWAVMRAATDWSQSIGWKPGPSDARSSSASRMWPNNRS